MKLLVTALIGFALIGTITASPSFAQAAPNEPTKQEIAEAYRDRVIVLRWEKRRTKEIRGWSLHFKRVSEKRGVGILTRQYHAVAKKNGSCAEYQITDTMPFPPNNVQMKPMLVVEPSAVTACR